MLPHHENKVVNNVITQNEQLSLRRTYKIGTGVMEVWENQRMLADLCEFLLPPAICVLDEDEFVKASSHPRLGRYQIDRRTGRGEYSVLIEGVWLIWESQCLSIPDPRPERLF